MSKTLRSVAVGTLVIAGVGALLYAGPLAPPPGPVQSTGASLGEIAGLLQVQQCASCRWQYKFVTTSPDGNMYTVELPGSGILHAIAIAEGEGEYLYDSATANDTAHPIAKVSGAAGVCVFDVGFTRGISIKGRLGNEKLTLIYRLD